MPHQAEIIAVGTELLLGNIANTNAQFLSQLLASAGVNVLYHTAVGDNPQRLRAAVETARSRCGLLVFTPYFQWRFEHAVHHATSGDLDRRGRAASRRSRTSRRRGR